MGERGHDWGAEHHITCFGAAKGKGWNDCAYMYEHEIFLFVALYSATSPVSRSVISQES